MAHLPSLYPCPQLHPWILSTCPLSIGFETDQSLGFASPPPFRGFGCWCCSELVLSAYPLYPGGPRVFRILHCATNRTWTTADWRWFRLDTGRSDVSNPTRKYATPEKGKGTCFKKNNGSSTPNEFFPFWIESELFGRSKQVVEWMVDRLVKTADELFHWVISPVNISFQSILTLVSHKTLLLTTLGFYISKPLVLRSINQNNKPFTFNQPT